MSKKIQLLLGLLAALVLTGVGCIQFTNTSKGQMGVFRSNDGGEIWQQKSVLLTAQGIKSLAGAKVYKILTDPSDPKALYMGTRGQGLFYSYDSGDTWLATAAMAFMGCTGMGIPKANPVTIFINPAAMSDGTSCSPHCDTIATSKGMNVPKSPSEPASSARLKRTNPSRSGRVKSCANPFDFEWRGVVIESFYTVRMSR